MIEVQNISFKYAGQKGLVFDDFSLTLKQDNIYGLLGKNGTGKSTLLYLISGLLRPAKGSVCFDGIETRKRLPETFALAAGTKVLLMDEPTNGLDIPSKSQFRKVVAQYMTEDRTLIISTHQVHDVESLLDHILILSQQKLLLDATVAEITEKYVFEYRTPDEMEDALYAEPSLQGNAVIAPRKADSAETQVNLELLFNAVTQGKI